MGLSDIGVTRDCGSLLLLEGLGAWCLWVLIAAMGRPMLSLSGPRDRMLEELYLFRRLKKMRY